MYRFDESDPACKSPQGALPQGQALTLSLRYLRDHCEKAFLVWKKDGGEPRSLPFGWQETRGIDDCFTVRFILDEPGLYWYWFRIETAEGGFIIDHSGPGDEPAAPYQLTVYDDSLRTPDWIKGGVMYHIFVDRFARSSRGRGALKPGDIPREDWGGIPEFRPDANGIVLNNDFFGGNLEGIIEKLPYLTEQGVTCLYLSPVFEASSNHKYDTGCFKRVDPGFGDEELLKRLCREAGALGIHVVLDGVFSHVGIDSEYFNKYGRYDSLGAYQSQASPYYSWFIFNEWPDDYVCWWDILLLPEIDKNDPSYQNYIAGKDGVARYWQDRGISGWRLDVVDELPDSFLDLLCAGVREKNPDALIIGEVWEDASNKIAYNTRRRYLLGGQLDSVMNYPLRDAIIAYTRDKDVNTIARTMTALIQNYPKPILDALMNIIGTHDTMRALTVLGGEDIPGTKEEMSRYSLTEERLAYGKKMLKIASALQFTLPGFPCVYYGDEAGMQGGADPFNRLCYPWGGEDKDLVAWYRTLARIRSAHHAFREGVFRLVAARRGVFAFTRGEGDDTILVAANVGDEEYFFPWPDFLYDLIKEQYMNVCSVCGGSVAIYSKGGIQA